MQNSLSGIQQLSVRGRRPALSEGERIYAFGDLHGRLDLLDELLGRVADDISVRPVARRSLFFSATTSIVGRNRARPSIG